MMRVGKRLNFEEAIAYLRQPVLVEPTTSHLWRNHKKFSPISVLFVTALLTTTNLIKKTLNCQALNSPVGHSQTHKLKHGKHQPQLLRILTNKLATAIDT
jgi:hypothetical protein